MTTGSLQAWVSLAKYCLVAPDLGTLLQQDAAKEPGDRRLLIHYLKGSK